jgi:hypothetical protein
MSCFLRIGLLRVALHILGVRSARHFGRFIGSRAIEELESNLEKDWKMEINLYRKHAIPGHIVRGTYVKSYSDHPMSIILHCSDVT